MSKRRRILFAAVTAAVGMMLVSGCTSEKEIAASTAAERATEVKPMICAVEEAERKPVREDFAPEKTREARVALRATEAAESTESKKSASLPPAKEETVPIPETQGEKNISLTPSSQGADTGPVPAAWNEESSLSDNNIAQKQDKVNTEEAPLAEISCSANGWQPTAAEHDHGTGMDSGTCPACGLLYGPAGGGQGQYTVQDGLMD